jgi:hypothetical protein
VGLPALTISLLADFLFNTILMSSLAFRLAARALSSRRRRLYSVGSQRNGHPMKHRSLDERLAAAKNRAARWLGEVEHLEKVGFVIEKKRETRRKIWVGAWALNEMKKDRALLRKFVEHLRSAKLRKGEAELFEELLRLFEEGEDEEPDETPQEG